MLTTGGKFQCIFILNQHAAAYSYIWMKSWGNLGKFHVQQQKCATVCLEVFRQWIHDQIVSGCALKPDFACLNFNTPYLLKLRGTYQKAVTDLWVRELCLRLGKGLQLQPDLENKISCLLLQTQPWGQKVACNGVKQSSETRRRCWGQEVKGALSSSGGGGLVVNIVHRFT